MWDNYQKTWVATILSLNANLKPRGHKNFAVGDAAT